MSEMRALLADTTARLLAEHCTAEAIAAAERGCFPAALWRALEEGGLTTATIAEAKGGSGADLGDAMTILRAAGFHAAPAPLAETQLAAWLLSESGLAVPTGPLTIAPVLPEERLRLAGDRLSGTARAVPWARDCAEIVVIADGLIARVATADATVTPRQSIAGEPRDDVRFDGVLIAADRMALAGPGIDAPALERHGALARTAQMAGALEAVLDLTLRYAGERVQFGRAIAKFQAVQQLIATLAAETAAATGAADAATAAAERGDAAFAIACAKARINEAASRAAAIAHQVHGAIGFTREHRLNFLTRRLWAWRDEFGDESFWWARLGRAAAALGGGGLWPFLTSADPRLPAAQP